MRKASFLEKAKESRLGGGNGIGSRSGGGNGIDKEVDRTGGGIGDEYTDQDEGKGRRIEAEEIVGGGLESSVERESGHAGRIDTGAGVESFLFDDVEEWGSAGDKMGHCTGQGSRGRSREPRRALTSSKTTR